MDQTAWSRRTFVPRVLNGEGFALSWGKYQRKAVWKRETGKARERNFLSVAPPSRSFSLEEMSIGSSSSLGR